ncbi:hypothetical protein D9613_001901 [Agrocybe pediades]|uniref:BZIP domain-containing protein n=1 Tax=Agrocybe pediades TaxID=84607 RepID=A0A8H4VVE7_9AGAR|nr:hypothetical protein D9613_001901 [Agrocybe pediades]
MTSLSNPSSSTTLWATASKEWVIQPKPKPGRKPKKDVASPSRGETEQADTKGRRTQNRAAQRAFRERKQSQLSELQARIQMYEQGEIERNVALQNIAKRLKEENEKLRKENAELLAKLQLLQQQQQPPQPVPGSEKHIEDVQDKKRGRDDSVCPMSKQPSSQKKPRTESVADCRPLPPSVAFHMSTTSSTPSMASTPDSNGTSDTQFSVMPYDLQAEISTDAFNQFPADIGMERKTASACLTSFSTFGCGFCDESSLCVCREIAVQHIVNANAHDFKTTAYDEPPALVGQNHDMPPHQTPKPMSILDNLPAYQPPVALRKRPGKTAMNSVFPVKTMAASEKKIDANCSGDPSNCLACGDDAFGKAFCAAMGYTASAVCDDCPSKANSSSSAGSGCCGLSGDGMPCATCPSTKNTTLSPEEASDYMPTNAAWLKLKAHPNVEFADLTLLAEVVSSRSKCSGPQLVLASSQQDAKQNATGCGDNIVDALRRDGASPPPRLVPQEILLECGRRRVRQVHADGVREALRMLDAKFM